MRRIRPEFVLPFRALLILCAVFVDALLVWLLLLQVRGPARRTIRVRKVNGAIVGVTTESLSERLKYHLDQLADVINVKVKVAPRGDNVDVELDVQTGTEVNVPEKAAQVLEIARQVIEDKMGLKLARKPRVNVHAMPYPGFASRPVQHAPTVATQQTDLPSPPA